MTTEEKLQQVQLLSDGQVTEAGVLAGLTQAPSAYDLFVAPDRAVARRNEVLDAMLQQGTITPSQHAWATATRSPGLRPGNLYRTIKEPYFFGYVRDELIRAYGVETVRSGGLRVYTTILPRWQKLAKRAIAAFSRTGPIPRPR